MTVLARTGIRVTRETRLVVYIGGGAILFVGALMLVVIWISSISREIDRSTELVYAVQKVDRVVYKVDPMPAAEIRQFRAIFSARGYTDKEIFLCLTRLGLVQECIAGKHPPLELVKTIGGFDGTWKPEDR